MGDSTLSSSSTANLPTRFIGQKTIYYPRLASTMDVARRKARQGAADGTVIIAGEQTEGRGRAKHTWLSPPGNIALSIILQPEISWLPCLIMIASLAVVNSIEAVTGLKPQIKWPNDIFINGKKVCGILIENEVKGRRPAFTVIGIGINVCLRPSDIAGISAIATSLNDEAGRDISSVELVRRLLVEMEHLYLALPDGGPVYREWRGRLVTLGRSVRVETGDIVFEGIAESVDESGALILRHNNGTLTRVVAGDVTLRDE
jgi:BirA family biotin operon repressor/biotin-[acetyl-CoA-carboxylase] ligase